MKKTILLGILIGMFLCASVAISQAAPDSWHTANQVTVSWDPVTTLGNDTSLPEGSIIKYELFMANMITDPNKTNPASIGITDQTSYTLTLNVEGRFLLGIKTLRYVLEADGVTETLVESSDYGWTDDPEIVANGQTFGVRYFLPPGKIKGFKLNQSEETKDVEGS